MCLVLGHAECVSGLQCVCVCAWDVCAPGLFSCCDEAKGGSNTHPAPNPLRQRTPKHRFVRKKKRCCAEWVLMLFLLPELQSPPPPSLCLGARLQTTAIPLTVSRSYYPLSLTSIYSILFWLPFHPASLSQHHSLSLSLSFY